MLLDLGIKNIFVTAVVIFSCQSMSARSAESLAVGVYDCPPFVMKTDGNFHGLAIALWKHVAEDVGIQYHLEEHELPELLKGIENGSLDAGVSCLSITEEREALLDFSHSFYETHLAIAVKQKGLLSSLLSAVSSRNFLILIGIFCSMACLIGGVYYRLEHRVNSKLYSMESRGAKLVEGFILGLLFITKGPFNYYEFKTLSGRVLTVLLAVLTTFFIASITAVLASTFTVNSINSDIKGPADLARLQVAAKEASTSAQFLTSRGINYKSYVTTEEMLVALERGQVDAVVDDDAILRYRLKSAREEGNHEQLTVLPYSFEQQNYGFALQDNSPHEEAIDQKLLRLRTTVRWQEALKQFFGTE